MLSGYKTLKNGETFKAEKPEINEAVTMCKAVYATKIDGKDSIRYVMTTTFDFDGVTPQELLELATRRLIVDRQNEWRKSASKANANAADWDNQTVRVREILDRERAKPGQRPLTADKIKEFVTKSDLSSEDLQAMLQAIQAKLQG